MATGLVQELETTKHCVQLAACGLSPATKWWPTKFGQQQQQALFEQGAYLAPWNKS